MGICEDLLQANGDVVAIFGGNDPTALGALAAANAAGMTEVLMTALMDPLTLKQNLLQENPSLKEQEHSLQSISKTSVDVMYKYLAGETVDDRYPVETFLITSDNVAEFGTDGWQ